MKLQEIVKKTDQELQELINSARAELAQAIIDSRTKEVRNTKEQTKHKKTIARALTIKREREIAATEETQ